MRLLVAEGPEGRQLGAPGQPCPLGHEVDGIARVDHEHVQRPAGTLGRIEAAAWAAQVEGAERLMDVEAPAVGAHEPLNGHPAAVRAELVAPLPALHPVDRAPAVELRAPFAHPEQRSVSQVEPERAARPVDAELLHDSAVRPADADPERVTRDADSKLPDGEADRKST